jgi:hypothetical protein
MPYDNCDKLLKALVNRLTNCKPFQLLAKPGIALDMCRAVVVAITQALLNDDVDNMTWPDWVPPANRSKASQHIKAIKDLGESRA